MTGMPPSPPHPVMPPSARIAENSEDLTPRPAVPVRREQGGLLELAFCYAMGEEAELVAVVPLPTRPPGPTLELLRSWLKVHATFPALRAALKRDPGEDASEELAGIIDELYGFVEQNRLLLLLLESLVMDYPEFNALCVSESKDSHIGAAVPWLRGGGAWVSAWVGLAAGSDGGPCGHGEAGRLTRVPGGLSGPAQRVGFITVRMS
jgi:hypothetical protein